MLNSSQSSFIPKNNTKKKPPVGRRYNFFFVSIVVYGAFIATPIASAAVFIYERHTSNVLAQTIIDLDAELKSFNESDLLLLRQFDHRLSAGMEVLDSITPTHTVLQLLSQSAPKTVEFTGIEIAVVDERTLEVTAEVAANSFDYVLFFKDELLQNSLFVDVSISDLEYQNPAVEESVTDAGGAAISKLQYTLTFNIPISAIASLESLVAEDEVLAIESSATDQSLFGNDDSI